MSSSSRTQIALDLINLLMESTAIYVSNRILNSKDREAYIKSMRSCLYTINHIKDTALILEELKRVKANYPTRFISRFEIFSNVKKYYMHGVDDSIDIVRSIQARFETGSAHEDVVFVRSLLRGKNED